MRNSNGQYQRPKQDTSQRESDGAAQQQREERERERDGMGEAMRSQNGHQRSTQDTLHTQKKQDSKRVLRKSTPVEDLALIHDARAVRTMMRFARLLLTGSTITMAAKQLGKHYSYLRKVNALPEFKAYYQELERDYYAAIDTKAKRSMGASVDTLVKLLKHPNWKARVDAAEILLRVNGKLDRLNITGSLDHTGRVQHQHKHAHAVGIVSEENMSDRQRELARELLTLSRQPRALPPGMRDPHKVQVLDVTPVPVPEPVPVPQEPPAPPSVMKVHRARL
jgi:hypothetical protein